MFRTKLKRVLRNGLVSFVRNPVISLASLLTMTVTLFIVGSLVISGALLDASLAEIREKVDINVYFKTDATEDQILGIRDSLESLPEVARVEYISREESFANFKNRHANNSLIIQSLEEIGENPLGASLNIKAKDPSQYESIAKFLDAETALGVSNEDSSIEKVNFQQNKLVIDRMASLIDSTETLGLAITILFSLLAVVVTFNTIRLSIFTARDEIAVMRLVGASKNYVRGPFVVTGLMYGVLAAVLVAALMYPITAGLGDATGSFFGSLNIFEYYVDNFFQILGILLVAGITLGALSSFLAVRKHLAV